MPALIAGAFPGPGAGSGLAGMEHLLAARTSGSTGQAARLLGGTRTMSGRPPTGNPIGHPIGNRARYVREREPHPMTIRRTVAPRVREAVHDKEVEAEAARVPHRKRSLPQLVGKPARHALRAFEAPGSNDRSTPYSPCW